MFGVELDEALVDITKLDFSQVDKALAFGGTMLLIGVATVFAVLCLLWLCLTVFKVFFHDLPQRKKATKVVEEHAVDKKAMGAPVVTTNADAELIAVITAAIAMAESENSGLKFRVVSFKRK